MATAAAGLDTLAAAASVSNLNTLDDKTKRYLEILHTKQQLLDQIRDLQTELNTLKEPLIDQLSHTAQSVQICPSSTEEKIYGGMGALVLKLRNDYETMTRETIVRLLTEFYEYLLPESNAEEVVSLGQGTAHWIWNNRKRVPVRYLERSFAVKAPSAAQKRKAAEMVAAAAAVAAGGVPPSLPAPPPKAARGPRFKPVANLPHTRDDFLAISSLSKVLSSPPELPQQQPSTDEDTEVFD